MEADLLDPAPVPRPAHPLGRQLSSGEGHNTGRRTGRLFDIDGSGGSETVNSERPSGSAIDASRNPFLVSRSSPPPPPPPPHRPPSVILPASGATVAVALETDKHALTPLQPHRATAYPPSGLVLDQGRRATCDRVRLVLETMVDTARDLTGLLLVLGTFEYPTRPHPSLNPHVSVLSRRAILPLSVAFLARWVRCHLQAWHRIAGGLLPMGMPRPPPPPKAQWTPRVTFLVRPDLSSLSVGHLIQALTDPLLVLTSTPGVHALQRLVSAPLKTLAIRDHVLLWDASVAHTLPQQDRFR